MRDAPTPSAVPESARFKGHHACRTSQQRTDFDLADPQIASGAIDAMVP